MRRTCVAFRLQRHDRTAVNKGTILADKQIPVSAEFCSVSSVLNAERTWTYIHWFYHLFVSLIADNIAVAGHEFFIHILIDGSVWLDEVRGGK